MLEGSLKINISVQPEKVYVLDETKIKNIEDIVKILMALQISFSEDYPGIESIKDYVKLTDSNLG